VTSFIDDLIGYVGLDADVQARLRALHPLLQPHFEDVARRFYAAIDAAPAAASLLDGPDQIARLRGTLVDWMSTGLLGPYDDRFYEKRSRIGRRHVQIGLAQHFMFSAVNVVRTTYIELIARLVAPNEVVGACRAINKLLDLELALMLRHYQIDSEERLVQRERDILSDRLASMQTLSAGLAHEVRNPLNAARLQLELLERRLRRQLGAESPLIEQTVLAGHEIERLTELLNDFLAFARPPELHVRDHDVVAICRQVLELERPLAEKRSITVELRTPGPVVASVDSGKIHQVIQNLVRNAIEAAPTGGQVDVEVVRDGGTTHLRVRDNGGGIPAETMARIYEPFFSTKQNGTGMGMAIVHSLVTLHGGRIAIDTGARGTAIDVSLPAHARTPQQPA